MDMSRSHLTTGMDSAKSGRISRTICNVSEKQTCVSLDVVGRGKERRLKLEQVTADPGCRQFYKQSFIGTRTHSFTYWLN